MPTLLLHRSIRRVRTPFFAVVAATATFSFILYSHWQLSRSSLTGFCDETANNRLLRPILTRFLELRSVEVSPEFEPSDEELEDKVTRPPVNLTGEDRIAWLQSKLSDFHIFDSDSQFHSRLRQFFDSNQCDLNFFMTWILPAGIFGSREMLAIETLFKTHPRGCLLIISRSLDSRKGAKIIKPLVDRGFKILAAAPDLNSVFGKTPAESWLSDIRSGNTDPGEIPLAQNLSNLIRLAILYKYGGVYLDNDIIVLNDFSGLRNTIGAQSVDLASGNWSRINNAVMVFDAGHPLLYMFMEEFALTFDGSKWGHNGPYLVSRVIDRVQRSAGERENFTVLPPLAFYPVDWTRIRGMFKQPENRADRKWVEAKLLQLSQKTYAVHLWNKQSRGFTIEEGSVIGRLMSDHCIICKGIYSDRRKAQYI